MKSLFVEADRQDLVSRLQSLRPDSQRRWGKMAPAQMLCHCAIALEAGTGDKPTKQLFIGKLLSRFVRGVGLGEKPFSRNSPTDPSFVVSDERDFNAERTRLAALIDRFASLGPAAAATQTHAFFGKLSGEEWGRLMYKHIDHHLQQFGV